MNDNDKRERVSFFGEEDEEIIIMAMLLHSTGGCTGRCNNQTTIHTYTYNTLYTHDIYIHTLYIHKFTLYKDGNCDTQRSITVYSLSSRLKTTMGSWLLLANGVKPSMSEKKMVTNSYLWV